MFGNAVEKLLFIGLTSTLALGACTSLLGEIEGTGSSSSGSGSGSGSGSNTTSGRGGDDASTSGAGGGGAGGTVSGSGGNAPVLSCELYCDAIMDRCKQENAEYTSPEVCAAMCKTFEKGDANDPTGNTLACRMVHVELAANDAVTHCQQAGPLAGTCTDPCSAFCELTTGFCEDYEIFPYPSFAACKDACAGYPYLLARDPGSHADAGTAVGDVMYAGNTLNCRLYHLEIAYDPMSSTNYSHCNHVGAFGPCN
jgi:hypothetical protein